MDRTGILHEIDAAIAKRNPQLVPYLRPGLPTKIIERRLKKVTGLIRPLFDLYSWHDGTDFLHLAPGETFSQGM